MRQDQYEAMRLKKGYVSTQATCVRPHWRSWQCSIGNKVAVRRQVAELLFYAVSLTTQIMPMAMTYSLTFFQPPAFGKVATYHLETAGASLV